MVFFAMNEATAVQNYCAPEVSLKVKVAENLPPLSSPVTFSVTVKNPAKITANCMLPTAQIYDVVVRREGRTVWRWSEGKRFASVLTPYTLAAGGAKSYQAEWEASEGALRDTLENRAMPGEYEAFAIFKARPEVLSALVFFQIPPPKGN